MNLDSDYLVSFLLVDELIIYEAWVFLIKLNKKGVVYLYFRD